MESKCAESTGHCTQTSVKARLSRLCRRMRTLASARVQPPWVEGPEGSLPLAAADPLPLASGPELWIAEEFDPSPAGFPDFGEQLQAAKPRRPRRPRMGRVTGMIRG